MNTYDLLKAMSEIAPRSHVRHYLNGIHVMRGDDDKVTVEATDGRCSMRVTLSDPDAMGVNVAPSTDVILCRNSVAKMLRMYTRKTPPPITIGGVRAHLCTYRVDTLDGRYPEVGVPIMARTRKTQSADAQGFDLTLMARATKAMSKLAGDGALTSTHGERGIKMEADTEAGRVELLVMPCRLQTHSH